MPWRASRKATEKMPADADAATGVSAIVQVAPPSSVISMRQRAAAPVPIQARPIAGRRCWCRCRRTPPSFGSAGGSRSGGTRAHVCAAVSGGEDDELAVDRVAHDQAAPASQNAIASKNALGSSLVNCSAQCAPASVVL